MKHKNIYGNALFTHSIFLVNLILQYNFIFLMPLFFKIIIKLRNEEKKCIELGFFFKHFCVYYKTGMFVTCPCDFKK